MHESGDACEVAHLRCRLIQAKGSSTIQRFGSLESSQTEPHPIHPTDTFLDRLLQSEDQ
jgi:hypothetical protein